MLLRTGASCTFAASVSIIQLDRLALGPAESLGDEQDCEQHPRERTTSRNCRVGAPTRHPPQEVAPRASSRTNSGARSAGSESAVESACVRDRVIARDRGDWRTMGYFARQVRGLAGFTAGALLTITAACSFIGVRGPLSGPIEPKPPLDCTTSRVAPALDVALPLGFLIAVPKSASNEGSAKALAILTVVVAGVGIGSAVYGFTKTGQCDALVDWQERCLGGDAASCNALRMRDGSAATTPIPGPVGLKPCDSNMDCAEVGGICFEGKCRSHPTPEHGAARRCQAAALSSPHRRVPGASARLAAPVRRLRAAAPLCARTAPAACLCTTTCAAGAANSMRPGPTAGCRGQIRGRMPPQPWRGHLALEQPSLEAMAMAIGRISPLLSPPASVPPSLPA